MMLTLRQLTYFAKVVETRNITRAAEQLHVAQPALGTQLRQLEAHLGVPLLHRHSRGVDATPAGQLLYQRTQDVLALLDRTEADIRELQGTDARPVKLGLTASLVHLIGADLMVWASRAAPGQALKLREEPSFLLVDALERQEIDLALAYCAPARPGLAVHPLLEEEIPFVVRADRAPPGTSMMLEDALSFDLAMGGERDVGRRLLVDAAASHRLTCRVTYETQSIAGIRDLLMRGLAASVIPYGSVARELETGELVARRLVPSMSMTLCLVRRRADADADGSCDFRDALVVQCLAMIRERLGPFVLSP
ncbi:LysR family transcriptional regulator [Pigmentiphaga litoralis]|uniref:LysR family transcriptional regulator n=1 Tax=Pigmentiphaga litoralis TaxID=516702 RepID=UPI003B4313C8